MPKILDEEVQNLNAILSNVTTLITKEQINDFPEVELKIKAHAAEIFNVPLIEDSAVLKYIGLSG